MKKIALMIMVCFCTIGTNQAKSDIYNYRSCSDLYSDNEEIKDKNGQLFKKGLITEFMGIPVDGYKKDMIKKLKEKGFVSSTTDKDILEGEFNGTQVNVHVATNNNKVCRIMLCDAHQMDETDIKIRFNKLCQQFKNNSKYTSLDDYTIPEDEDISYEMGVNSKRYEAIFYQNPVITDSLAIANDITKMSLSYAMDLMSKKPVWFMISEFYGKYYITMFYDNEYNRANGEDL